jgi:hypothetical protein
MKETREVAMMLKATIFNEAMLEFWWSVRNLLDIGSLVFIAYRRASCHLLWSG